VLDDENYVRSSPLLGPLLARPPRGVVPDVPCFREPGKRVRYRVGQILRSRPDGLAMSEIVRLTGFARGEINSAIGRMRQAGEVDAQSNETGRYVYRWRVNV